MAKNDSKKDSKPVEDKTPEEMSDKELRETGTLRPVVAVNKPTPETPDRQVVDPEQPATEVDPDPTGTDEAVKKADRERAEGQANGEVYGFEHPYNDSPTQSIKAHEGTEQTEPKK